jgi:MFS family permease
VAVPPDHDLTPQQTSRAQRAFLAMGALIGVYQPVGMFNSPVLGAFALFILGMSKEDAGMVGAFAACAALTQPFSFVVTNAVRDKRRFMVLAGAAEAGLRAAVLLVPLLMFRGGRAPAGWAVFLGLMFLSGLCSSLVQPMLSSWISVVVPAETRGRYLSLLNLLTVGLHTAFGWAALQAIHRWQSFPGFAAVILFCSVAGVAAYLVVARAPMPAVSGRSAFGLSVFPNSWRHQPFRRYLLFGVALYLPFGFACSYYTPFALEVVRLTPAQMATYWTLFSVMRLAGLRPVGWLVDRIGARQTLHAMVLLYSIFFFGFPFFSADHMPLVVLMWMLAGLADSCAMVAVTSVLFHALPRTPERAGFLAVAQALNRGILGFFPFVARAYLAWADGVEFVLLGVRFEKFRLMYAACGVVMFLAHLGVRRLEDTRQGDARRFLGRAVRRIGLRVMRLWRLGRRREAA